MWEHLCDVQKYTAQAKNRRQAHGRWLAIRAVRVRHFGYPYPTRPVLRYPYPTRTRVAVPVPVPAGTGIPVTLPVYQRRCQEFFLRGEGEYAALLRAEGLKFEAEGSEQGGRFGNGVANLSSPARRSGRAL